MPPTARRDAGPPPSHSPSGNPLSPSDSPLRYLAFSFPRAFSANAIREFQAEVRSIFREHGNIVTNDEDFRTDAGGSGHQGRADYAALIEKRNFVSLRYTKEATGWAEKLLVVDPTCYDAHLATGVSRYIIGSMAAPVRWILHLGGVSGDKQAGIADLRITAQKGRYLAPFARILLAIAYVREHDKPQARALLASLQQEFPNNTLFTREIARIDSAR